MGPTQINSDDEWGMLAELAQAGDKLAYAQLLREISAFIKNYLITRVANPDWADDITQEVLLSVHKSLGSYSPERAFKPWLMAIVGFRKADYLRVHYAKRGNMQVELNEATLKGQGVTILGHAGELKDIEAHLNKLNGKQRTIFEKMRIYGYTAQEVADELDMSVSAVKVSVHRSQKKLQEE